MSYYKITDPNILKQVNEFNRQRKNFIQHYYNIAEQINIGKPLFYTVEAGIYFYSFSIEDITQLDKKKWKVLKYIEKQKTYAVDVRRSNRKFSKEYLTLIPDVRTPFSYQPLYDLLTESNENTQIILIKSNDNVLIFETLSRLEIEFEYIQKISSGEFKAINQQIKKSKSNDKN